MAYRLKHGESVADGVKRIAREEIGAAARLLRAKRGVDRDHAIHEVRKSIKKLRALLRLVRPQLGPLYAAENSRLREAGRKLSELRDAGALIGALDDLKKRANGALGGQSLSSIHRALTVHKKQVEEEVGTPELLRSLAATLGQTRQAAASWPLEADGFAAVEPGLEKTFRDGKKALAVARKSGTREDFHEWRKRVKDHWYHIRLLEKVWTEVMEGYEHSLKELETALGDDLNLAMLRNRVASTSNATGLIRTIDASRQELRERALAIGERVYAGKPRQFIRQMKHLWEAWHGNSGAAVRGVSG